MTEARRAVKMAAACRSSRVGIAGCASLRMSACPSTGRRSSGDPHRKRAPSRLPCDCPPVIQHSNSLECLPCQRGPDSPRAPSPSRASRRCTRSLLERTLGCSHVRLRPNASSGHVPTGEERHSSPGRYRTRVGSCWRCCPWPASAPSRSSRNSHCRLRTNRQSTGLGCRSEAGG